MLIFTKQQLVPSEEDDTSKTPSQKKKMKKQRKAERAKKAEEKNEESSSSGISKSGKRHVKPVDPYPFGEKLLKVTYYYLFPVL
ncbi:N-terminal acetyltransferase A complex auxiliary subunit NAA15-like isoform X6 [Durio zibethinus]|uniref:N-terminal acetyltransferase A complex auxiliary subunit NAA15-like isoform X6 n=1 Tax=Durio zibethinus TaxID=66656 RepID=A0A6P5YXR2_DURZI|nr:N-terminal acetyltransferase A complex auxiliary subunit NAA15-like isoform X6 [Durio zibethinus]